MSRERRQWISEERHQMRQLRKAGHSDQYIADRLGRTRNSVRHQRRRMGLNDPLHMAWTASKLRKEISERQIRLDARQAEEGE